MQLLDVTIQSQILLESLESLQGTEFNKQSLKSALKVLIRQLEPLAEKNYNKAFGLDESALVNITFEYSQLSKTLSTLNIPDKVGLSQMISAFQLDPDSMQATTHRILKKHK